MSLKVADNTLDDRALARRNPTMLPGAEDSVLDMIDDSLRPNRWSNA